MLSKILTRRGGAAVPRWSWPVRGGSAADGRAALPPAATPPAGEAARDARRIAELEQQIETPRARGPPGRPRGRRSRRARPGGRRTAAGAREAGARHPGNRRACARNCVREAAADLVELSLGIARRILHREFSVDPAALEGLVGGALQKLAAQEICRIRVHPELEPGVRRALAREGPRRPAVDRRRQPWSAAPSWSRRPAGSWTPRSKPNSPRSDAGWPTACRRNEHARHPQSLPGGSGRPGTHAARGRSGGDGRPAGGIRRARRRPSAIFAKSRPPADARVRSQVIGFRDGRVLSMPLEETGGIELGNRVVARRDAARVAGGPGLVGTGARRIRPPDRSRSPHSRHAPLTTCTALRRVRSTGSTSPRR